MTDATPVEKMFPHPDRISLGDGERRAAHVTKTVKRLSQLLADIEALPSKPRLSVSHLNMEIAELLGGCKTRVNRYGSPLTRKGDYERWKKMAYYSLSLDDAFGLITPAWHLSSLWAYSNRLEIDEGRKWWCELRNQADDQRGSVGANAATAPLAIIAACAQVRIGYYEHGWKA